MNVVFFLYLFAFSNTVECYRSALVKVLESINQLDSGRGRKHSQNRIFDDHEIIETDNHIEELWITQKVNHFSDSDDRTWDMRYYKNSAHFKPGGPVFIHVGGNWKITLDPVAHSLFHDIAKENNGYLFYLEHRFYGKSQPFSELTVDNLKYLNAKQALADVAHFIKHIRKKHRKLRNSKIAIMGMSYAGALVTWFRKKHSDLADAVWAASAPLLAKVEYKQFIKSVSKSIKSVGNKTCIKKIARGFQDIQVMFRVYPKLMIKKFKGCDTFSYRSKFDSMTFYYTITSYFGKMVLKGRDAIKKACDDITSHRSSYKGVKKWLLKKLLKDKDCYDYSFSAVINDLDYKISYDEEQQKYRTLRQWFYQKCFEFGWFKTTTIKHQVFGRHIRLELFTEICCRLFKPKSKCKAPHKNIDKTNDYFGGLNPNVDHVIFTYGKLDPWRKLGMPSKNATLIPDYSHCQEVFPIDEDEDSEEMINAKRKVQRKLEDWLDGY